MNYYRIGADQPPAPQKQGPKQPAWMLAAPVLGLAVVLGAVVYVMPNNRESR